MPFVDELRWLDLLDIAIVAFLAYRLWVWIRGTRALQILIGLLLVGMVAFFAARYRLTTTSWIFSNLWTVLLLFILIVFQPEVRRVLERVSPLKLLTGRPGENGPPPVQEIIAAVAELSATRTGALLVLPGDDPLAEFLKGGIELDGRLTRQVLVGLFQKSSPVHDGAALVRADRIVSVGNYLPLTEQEGLPPELGTRHRAALGLTESCDATVVVVSEERGDVSVARDGTLRRCHDADALWAALRPPSSPPAPSRGLARRGLAVLARDPLAKGGAVLFAVVLWGFLAAPEDYRRTVADVPISYRLPEGLAPAGGLGRTAAVEVTGNRAILAQLRPEEMSLSADLSGLQRGTHTIDLQEAAPKVPPGVRVVAVEPRRIQVVLDRLETRSFPVEVHSRGRLPRGWNLEEVEVVPPQVGLTGFAGDLDRVTGVEAGPLNLAEVRGAWKGSRSVTVLPPAVKVQRVEPGQVEIRVRASRAGR